METLEDCFEEQMDTSYEHKDKSPSVTLLDLPQEILFCILEKLDILSICNFGRTCLKADTLVNNCDFLWKHLITKVRSSPKSIKHDREEGYPWKDVVKRNYGRNGIRRLWMDGCFSNVKCESDIPEDHMCDMDADTWGQILDAELKR